MRFGSKKKNPNPASIAASGKNRKSFVMRTAITYALYGKCDVVFLRK
jgi:hypothetical protein